MHGTEHSNLDSEIDRWFAGKDFAFDFTSMHFPTWAKVLAPLRDRPVRVLEIGSFEGRSALFFLNYLPQSRIMCVDPWSSFDLDQEAVALIPQVATEFPNAEGRFDRNLAAYADRTTKINGFSFDLLPELAIKREQFDVIYVDGDHKSVSAYRDCVLSWPLLPPGGIMLIDDYEWAFDFPEWKKPKLGVDAFVRDLPSAQYQELHRAYQLILRRID